MDDHQVLRGLFSFRCVVSLDCFCCGRGGHRACRRSRPAGRAQVSQQLRPVQDLPSSHADDASRRHDAVVLAGVHRLRVVLSCIRAPVHHADPARPHRAFRVVGSRLERPSMAAVHPVAARRRTARWYRRVPPRREMGLVYRQRCQRDAASAQDGQVGPHRVFPRAGLCYPRGVYQDRHRAPRPLRRALRSVTLATLPQASCRDRRCRQPETVR